LASTAAVSFVNNFGGTITAAEALIVQAGRDLNVQTTTALGGGHQVQFLDNVPFSSSQSYVINPQTIRELK
jgi:hypothetical protein